jgi:hypothetical protein
MDGPLPAAGLARTDDTDALFIASPPHGIGHDKHPAAPLPAQSQESRLLFGVAQTRAIEGLSIPEHGRRLLEGHPVLGVVERGLAPVPLKDSSVYTKLRARPDGRARRDRPAASPARLGSGRPFPRSARQGPAASPPPRIVLPDRRPGCPGPPGPRRRRTRPPGGVSARQLAFGGVTRLRGFLLALPSVAGFDAVRSLGIVCDAEADAQARLRRVAGSLAAAGLPVPQTPPGPGRGSAPGRASRQSARCALGIPRRRLSGGHRRPRGADYPRCCLVARKGRRRRLARGSPLTLPGVRTPTDRRRPPACCKGFPVRSIGRPHYNDRDGARVPRRLLAQAAVR